MSASPLWLISSLVASPFELTKAAQAWELELLHSVRAVIKLLEQFNLAQDCTVSNTSFRKFGSFEIDIHRGWRLVGLKKILPNAKAQTALAGSSQLSCNAHATYASLPKSWVAWCCTARWPSFVALSPSFCSPVPLNWNYAVLRLTWVACDRLESAADI